MEISVILPVYNEKDNLIPLCKETIDCLTKNYSDWEIIFIDDGSEDGSKEILSQLSQEFENVSIVFLRRNFGQTQAIQAGLDQAKGELIATMDSDMQNDPKDIIRLHDKMRELDVDLVNGWRENRSDPLSKKILSRIAAKLRRVFLGTDLNDYGCTLKLMKRDAAQNLNLKGELHRYIPPLLKMKGYQITEIPINHRPRNAGKSKYGYSRVFKGFIDLINVWFLKKYQRRPIHILGGLGLISMFLGLLFLLFATYQKINGISFSDTGATIISAMLLVTGVQLFVSGILADIAVKTRFADQDVYYIDEVAE